MKPWCITAIMLVSAAILPAQSAPDLSGVWSPASLRGPAAPPAPTPILLKPGYKEKYDARRAQEREASARGEQLVGARGLCDPYGMPSMMQVATYPVEILQTPKQVTLIAEAFSEVRRVYLGKPQMPLDDIDPGYYGRSVGHWDGDTLLVDTLGIKDTIQGYQNIPHSDKMHITERIRRTAPDALQDQVTIEDPVTLEKPITYTLSYKLTPNYEMVEFVCENNREYVDEKGVVRLKLHDK